VLQVERGLKKEKVLINHLKEDAVRASSKQGLIKAARIVGNIADLSSGPVAATAAAAADSDAPNAAERTRGGVGAVAAYDTQYGDLRGVRGALVEEVA
jgi:hypothetical protein